jgi:hypothetical protein
MTTKHSSKRKKHPTPPGPVGTPNPIGPNPPVNHPPPPQGDPIFGEPVPSPDPTTFVDPVTDQGIYGNNLLCPLPQAPSPTQFPEPTLTLQQVLGSAGTSTVAAIKAAGKIVFHGVGDTGSVSGPTTQSLVADKLVSDFSEQNPADVPRFFYHFGDVIYYFGEPTYYYDQFYEPYRDYPAPILGVPGNHDGVVYSKDPFTSLQGFLENFCTPAPVHSPDAGSLSRTTMIQPAVYFTFEAPFVRILGLYSNVLEDPGVISAQKGTTSPNTVLDNRQVDFLTAALKRVKSDKFAGAVIIVVHHPPYTGGSQHGGSPLMLADIDSACAAAGVYPHAVFSGHAHNYQRYTRTIAGKQIPFVVAGCGGHNPLSKLRANLRTPYPINSTLILESFDFIHYGYLRVIVDATTMVVEFHPAIDGSDTKTPDDKVTINLANYTVS